MFVSSVLRSDCSFPYNNYGVAQRPVIEFLRTLERLNQINVIWPESVMCDHETCTAQMGDTPLYHDDGHITYEASILLSRMLHIAEKLNFPARSANAVQ